MLVRPRVTCPRDMRLTQDVLVSQQHRVVDLCLSEPGLLVSGRENLDCNVLPLPLTPPHFTITALTWGGTQKKQTIWSETFGWENSWKQIINNFTDAVIRVSIILMWTFLDCRRK